MTPEPSTVEEVRLTSFKSFSRAALPLRNFTMIVGRNGSGKTNALEGLYVLSRLARGEEIGEALGGGGPGPPIRGGAAGCAPFGQSFFELGCVVRTGSSVVHLDVRVQTEPTVQIVHEALKVGKRDVLRSESGSNSSGRILARWDTTEDATSPRPDFSAGRLITSQALSRAPATRGGQVIRLAAAQVLGALRSTFALDPVPDQMRQYVPRHDVPLRPHAENLSAAVAALLADPPPANRLRMALREVSEQEIIDVTTPGSDLGDLTLTFVERFRDGPVLVPARLMGDGTLRFLAILVSLMQAPALYSLPQGLAEQETLGQMLVVVEGLENGLHASQASLLIRLIRDEVECRRTQAVVTTQSPAILDAIPGEEHRSVVVCQRDEHGGSTLTPLVDLPNYLDIVAGGGLGRAARQDRLRITNPRPNPVDVVDEILGRPDRRVPEHDIMSGVDGQTREATVESDD